MRGLEAGAGDDDNETVSRETIRANWVKTEAARDGRCFFLIATMRS
jgi:hypothetical protein